MAEGATRASVMLQHHQIDQSRYLAACTYRRTQQRGEIEWAPPFYFRVFAESSGKTARAATPTWLHHHFGHASWLQKTITASLLASRPRPRRVPCRVGTLSWGPESSAPYDQAFRRIEAQLSEPRSA